CGLSFLASNRAAEYSVPGIAQTKSCASATGRSGAQPITSPCPASAAAQRPAGGSGGSRRRPAGGHLQGEEAGTGSRFLSDPTRSASGGTEWAASKLRAVILPAEDETLLRDFAEASAGACSSASACATPPKRFTASQRFPSSASCSCCPPTWTCCRLRRPGRAATRSATAGLRDEPLPRRLRLRNWRTLLRLAKKRRILNLGVRNYPLPAVAQLQTGMSTPECLDFPAGRAVARCFHSFVGKGESRRRRLPRRNKKMQKKKTQKREDAEEEDRERRRRRRRRSRAA
uniref:DEAD/DEAH box helicase domain-containing protein n=1 Tax=Macrostomum lignano TaxID=282301 RepID=A0A1I8FLA1_9PLAT